MTTQIPGTDVRDVDNLTSDLSATSLSGDQRTGIQGQQQKLPAELPRGMQSAMADSGAAYAGYGTQPSGSVDTGLVDKPADGAYITRRTSGSAQGSGFKAMDIGCSPHAEEKPDALQSQRRASAGATEQPSGLTDRIASAASSGMATVSETANNAYNTAAQAVAGDNTAKTSSTTTSSMSTGPTVSERVTGAASSGYNTVASASANAYNSAAGAISNLVSGTTTDPAQVTTTTVPESVKDSQDIANAPPEASANLSAVVNKANVENELLASVKTQSATHTDTTSSVAGATQTVTNQTAGVFSNLYNAAANKVSDVIQTATQAASDTVSAVHKGANTSLEAGARGEPIPGANEEPAKIKSLEEIMAANQPQAQVASNEGEKLANINQSQQPASSTMTTTGQTSATSQHPGYGGQGGFGKSELENASRGWEQNITAKQDEHLKLAREREAAVTKPFSTITHETNPFAQNTSTTGIQSQPRDFMNEPLAGNNPFAQESSNQSGKMEDLARVYQSAESRDSAKDLEQTINPQVSILGEGNMTGAPAGADENLLKNLSAANPGIEAQAGATGKGDLLHPRADDLS